MRSSGQLLSAGVAWCLMLIAAVAQETVQNEAAWRKIEQYFVVPSQWQGDVGGYRSPRLFADGSLAKTPDDWRQRRKEIADHWHQLLGEWPPLITEPQVQLDQPQQRDGYVQHRIRFEWIPGQETSGYLLIPIGEGPHPAVVTVFYEPETAVGQGDKPNRDFARQLAMRGFVALSIGTTEATQAKTYALYYPSIDNAQVQPLSMLAYAAANAWHVLASREDIDAQRIGIVGHSFGGKWAMFASCLFDRFACAVWSDPGIAFDQRPSVNYWEPWYLGYHPPPWRKRGLVTKQNPAHGLYPKLLAAGRDLHELHALMAPRPFLVSGGSEDPPHRWQALNHTIEINRLLGHPHRVGMTNRPNHSPTAESNDIIYQFFEATLKR